MTLFASLVVERELLRASQLPRVFGDWIQIVGGIATAGLAIWILARLLQGQPLLWFTTAVPARRRETFKLLFVIAAAVAIVGYVPILLTEIIVRVWPAIVPRFMFLFLPRQQFNANLTYGDFVELVSGTFALAAVTAPIIWDTFAGCFRLQRIWAIARLSWKEAVRGRVFWIFAAIALVFLFAGWFVPYKAENQLRNYVSIVYIAMSVLFLITAGLLGSFSIPNDAKNNSIHTIVTKPVEKFEIVLGRFLGYGALLTIGLFVISLVSLLYVVRGVNEEARKESYRARVPIYGALHFVGTRSAKQGDSVGREWSYRGYIGGMSGRQRDSQRQYAIWDIADLPADVAGRPEPTLFEFSFDVFRLSKGRHEGKGVSCTFAFTDGTLGPDRLQIEANKVRDEREKRVEEADKEIVAFMNALAQIDGKAEKSGPASATMIQEAADKLKQKRDQRFADAMSGIGVKISNASDGDQRDKLLAKIVDETAASIDRALAAKYRLYLVRSVEVSDYHTQEFVVPPGVLEAILAGNVNRDDPTQPALRIFVSVDLTQDAQMVGVAPPDLYLVAHEMPFWQNFLKGVLGMWCTHMLVLGIAVACSTYLSGVISLLATMFLFVSGMFVDYLKEIADMKVDGGGPAESFIRLVKQMPIAGKLDPSPQKTLVDFVDDLFGWWVKKILNLIPDVNRHDLHQYVANGFDIAWFEVLLIDNGVPLLGYLVPWLILAYYLMKYREIANP